MSAASLFGAAVGAMTTQPNDLVTSLAAPKALHVIERKA